MGSDEKRDHERARRRALAREAGVEPPAENTRDPEEAPAPSVHRILSRLGSSSRETREACTDLLVARGGEAVPALIGALGHASPLVRFHSAQALGAIGDERAIEPLVERLSDREENRGSVAAGAEAALRAFGVRAVPALLAQLGCAPDEVLTRVVRLLGDIGSDVGTGVPEEPLRRLLREAGEYVRAQAAAAVRKVLGAGAIPDLLATLDDPSRWVRLAAAEALAHLGRPEARPVLEAILAGAEDAYEARWAEELLELLPG